MAGVLEQELTLAAAAELMWWRIPRLNPPILLPGRSICALLAVWLESHNQAWADYVVRILGPFHTSRPLSSCCSPVWSCSRVEAISVRVVPLVGRGNDRIRSIHCLRLRRTTILPHFSCVPSFSTSSLAQTIRHEGQYQICALS